MKNLKITEAEMLIKIMRLPVSRYVSPTNKEPKASERIKEREQASLEGIEDKEA